MKQINFDGAGNLTPIEPVVTVRPSAKQERPAFDEHLQRASTPKRAQENSPPRNDERDRSTPVESDQPSQEATPGNENYPCATASSASQPPKGTIQDPDSADDEKNEHEQADGELAPTVPVAIAAEPAMLARPKTDVAAEEEAALDAVVKTAAKQPKGNAKGSAKQQTAAAAVGAAKQAATAAAHAVNPESETDLQTVVAETAAGKKSKVTDAASRLKQLQPIKQADPDAAKVKTEETRTAVVSEQPAAEDSGDDKGDRKSRADKPALEIKAAHVAASAQQEAKAEADSAAVAATQSAAVVTAQAAADMQSAKESRDDNSPGRSRQGIEAGTGPVENNVKTGGDNPPPVAPGSPSRGSLESSGHASGRSGEASTLSETDRVRFVQRVARAFQTAADRGGPLRLRLSPPELGALRMEVSVRDGVLSARLEAETPAARAMLLDNLPELRQRLAEHNIRVENFDVDLLGQGFDGTREKAADADQWRQRNTAVGQNTRGKPADPAIETKPSPTGRQRSGDGRLNVII